MLSSRTSTSSSSQETGLSPFSCRVQSIGNLSTFGKTLSEACFPHHKKMDRDEWIQSASMVSVAASRVRLWEQRQQVTSPLFDSAGAAHTTGQKVLLKESPVFLQLQNRANQACSNAGRPSFFVIGVVGFCVSVSPATPFQMPAPMFEPSCCITYNYPPKLRSSFVAHPGYKINN